MKGHMKRGVLEPGRIVFRGKCQGFKGRYFKGTIKEQPRRTNKEGVHPGQPVNLYLRIMLLILVECPGYYPPPPCTHVMDSWPTFENA